MRIATYNIHRAIGSDGLEDPKRIAAVLRELNADIVALQEVGYASGIPGNVLEYLGESIQARVIEGVTFQDERGHYGNAVLSRLPIDRILLYDISVVGREPRNAIELTLPVDGFEVQIIATHLGLRPGERRHQVEQLTRLLAASTADIHVLLGDLNEWFLWGRPLRRLRRVFGRTPAPATFPATWPWLALDRLWVRPLSVIDSLRAHRSAAAKHASDHLPLIAELRLV
ncbi:MAG: endonuclease [Gammaproteobacteria bacterium]|nr:endonuclease [Gammaproteobacteria bacterium]